MPVEPFAPGSPTNWLRHAYSDLALANTLLQPQILLEQLCFHAQQAAEKALKAVLILYDIPVPRTHNLRTLYDLLPPDLVVPPDIQDAVGLSDYAVAGRYPGVSEPVEIDEYREAVDLAEAVVYWAERAIGASQSASSTPSDSV